MQKILIAAATLLAPARGLRQCRRHDLKYQFAECDQRTQVANVHFYYDKNECYPAEQVTSEALPPNKSESIPQYFSQAKCDKFCPEDGQYVKMELFPSAQ